MPTVIVVKATFDEEVGVWFTECADAPGLHIEAETFEALKDKLPGAIADLFECASDGSESGVRDVPVELIAHASTRVSLPIR